MATEEIRKIKRPSKQEQSAALKSYNELESILKGLKDDSPEIEIYEIGDRIKIPLKALELLTDILKAMGEGKPISIVPVSYTHLTLPTICSL